MWMTTATEFVSFQCFPGEADNLLLRLAFISRQRHPFAMIVLRALCSGFIDQASS